MEGEGQEKKIFQSKEVIPSGSDGWLAPNGEFYECKTVEHDDCAGFIVQGNDFDRFFDENNRWKKREILEKPPRFGLQDLGFALVRGDVLPLEDSSKITKIQLERLEKAGVRVIKPSDTSVEYDPEEVLKVIDGIAQNISVLPTVVKLRDQMVGQYGEDKIRALENGEIRASDVDQYSNYRLQAFRDINKFRRVPITNDLYLMDFYNRNDEYVEIIDQIFDACSPDFTDEMSIDFGRQKYAFRVVDLSGCKLLVEKGMYYHDGISGGMTGDFRFNTSIHIADDQSILSNIKRLVEIKWRGNPEITINNTDGYFSKVVKQINTASEQG